MMLNDEANLLFQSDSSSSKLNDEVKSSACILKSNLMLKCYH